MPYMRQRAESMSYEIIHGSPEGIVVLDSDIKIMDINAKARELLGIDAVSVVGLPLADFIQAVDFYMAWENNRNAEVRQMFVPKNTKYVDISINVLRDHNIMYASIIDVTDKVSYDKQLDAVKDETIATTDAVIKKQMRVAQEIASLLGETTAETKVTLLKLKKMLRETDKAQ